MKVNFSAAEPRLETSRCGVKTRHAGSAVRPDGGAEASAEHCAVLFLDEAKVCVLDPLAMRVAELKLEQNRYQVLHACGATATSASVCLLEKRASGLLRALSGLRMLEVSTRRAAFLSLRAGELRDLVDSACPQSERHGVGAVPGAHRLHETPDVCPDRLGREVKLLTDPVVG